MLAERLRFVQQAQHDLFAVHGGHDGDAQVVVLAADADAHAPVLRQAAFGDVQAAHDLEARDQRQLHLLGRRRRVHQHAVDAVAQPQRLLERLDVDVAGAVFDGLDQDEVGQLDDRGFLAGGGQLVEVDLLDGFPGDLHAVGVGLRLALLLGVLDDVLHAAALGGIDVVELVEDGLFRGDQRGDFQPGDAPHVVDGQHVERVGHRQEQLVLQPRDRDDLVVVGHFARAPGRRLPAGW